MIHKNMRRSQVWVKGTIKTVAKAAIKPCLQTIPQQRITGSRWKNGLKKNGCLGNRFFCAGKMLGLEKVRSKK